MMNDNIKPKIFAMYLPQYHCIPENDEFWGKGFTDWVTVKSAKPLYKNHNQPRIPLNNNYYDLSDRETVEWQARLAHDNGIYGFGVYHYWFNNEKNLLTAPAEVLRDSCDCNIKYFFSWDNASWKRSWSNVLGNDWAPIVDKNRKNHDGPEILIPYILGGESDWRNHYDYVRTHFLSSKYEKYHNRPLFSIIMYSPELVSMCDCWDKWAKEDGFEGMCFIFQNTPIDFKYQHSFLYNYEPHYVGWYNPSLGSKKKSILIRIVNKLLYTLRIKKMISIFSINERKTIKFYDYDDIWSRLNNYISANKQDNMIQGSFVGYDDSPRRGMKGSKIIKGGSPDKFKKYFGEFYQISMKQNQPYIFLTAWNEWGEGAYLEPDTKDGLGYLTAIREIVDNSK